MLADIFSLIDVMTISYDIYLWRNDLTSKLKFKVNCAGLNNSINFNLDNVNIDLHNIYFRQFKEI